MDSKVISFNEELEDMREKYNELKNENASKNNMNDDTPMCERHEANYIQSEDYQNQKSHDSSSRQSLHDHNDSEKSFTKLNNDVKYDLEDFKRCIRSMRTIHDKLFDRDDGKTTGVLPNKMSKPINQEPQPKTDLEKSITKFLDGQRVTNMFFKNNVNDMILKMKQNEKNFQTKIKNIERKIDEWEKSQNVFSKQTDRTNLPPPPQAQTEHVNAVFTRSGKSDDSPKIQKDPPPSIIVNNKIKKDKPIKTSKRAITVISATSVSRPHLKSNRLEDRVLHKNSQGKMKEVENHRRNFKFSNNKMSVTVCNDSLNVKTLNVNFVCVTCVKCVLNDNHDLCILHYINGVNSRIKQTIVVPISTREPKRTVNQSVTTPYKRTVASESTNQTPSILRKLYEHVRKTCSWWYPKLTPPGYKWKPKSKEENANITVSMPLGIKSRTSNISEPKTVRGFNLSNTPLSSNSFAARRDNHIHLRI
ncbi:hypothetical protein Tco_0789111 [Tanacetum coccineum]